MFVSLAITFLSSSTMSQVNMTDEPQPTWPESELDASLDTGISTQALNDYAAIHQKLVSQDTLAVYPQVTHPRLLVFKSRLCLISLGIQPKVCLKIPVQLPAPVRIHMSMATRKRSHPPQSPLNLLHPCVVSQFFRNSLRSQDYQSSG